MCFSSLAASCCLGAENPRIPAVQISRATSFPDGQSCLNLAAARLRHIAETQWSTRKYMNMDPLNAAKTQPHGAVVA